MVLFTMNLKRIIWRMLEIYKWAWRVFFPLWASFLIASALTYAGKLCLIALILLILAIICLIIAIATITYHIKDARRKEREEKYSREHPHLV